MKKLVAIACLALLTTGVFAQGTVDFQNGTATKVLNMPSAPAGAYFFELLTAPLGTTDPKAFTGSGLMGTNRNNIATAMTGGFGKTVAGWAAGTSRAFEVAGWSADLGATFQAGWLLGDFVGAGASSVFGLSMIGAGAAGGLLTDGSSLPALSIFGAAPSITQGWTLNAIPEPTSMALAGLGAAAMLIFRRRN